MRPLLKPVLLLTLLFTALVGVIYARPADSPLRRLLTPMEECAAPCFMGIRPGVTTREEVIAILEAHPWIGEISFPQPESITWQWNGLQPYGVNPNRGDFAGYVFFNADNTVFGITVPTRIRFGDILLFFDKLRLFDHRTIRKDGIDYIRSQHCIGNPPFYWHTSASISLWDYSQYGGMGLGGGPDCI